MANNSNYFPINHGPQLVTLLIHIHVTVLVHTSNCLVDHPATPIKFCIKNFANHPPITCLLPLCCHAGNCLKKNLAATYKLLGCGQQVAHSIINQQLLLCNQLVSLKCKPVCDQVVVCQKHLSLFRAGRRGTVKTYTRI